MAKNEIAEHKTIKHKGKDYRIYTWENKPIGDLKVEGFEIAEFEDFMEIVNKGKFELELHKTYFVKHFYKKSMFPLSWVYLSGGGYVGARDGHLSASDDGGRVVMVKTYRGILYAVPKELDLTKYNLVKHG